LPKARKIAENSILAELAQKQPKTGSEAILADDPDIKPRHFGDVISTGKLFHLMFIFKWKWKTNIIGQNMQQMDLSCIENNIVLQYQSVIWSKLIEKH
jgi:hypothetical protein